jgi:membrane protein DedA with SNARE-associated domain
MLALLFFALALPAVLVAFILGAALAYRRGKRAGRTALLNVMRRMAEDEKYAAEALAAARTVLAERTRPTS